MCEFQSLPSKQRLLDSLLREAQRRSFGVEDFCLGYPSRELSVLPLLHPRQMSVSYSRHCRQKLRWVRRYQEKTRKSLSACSGYFPERTRVCVDIANYSLAVAWLSSASLSCFETKSDSKRK